MPRFFRNTWKYNEIVWCLSFFCSENEIKNNSYLVPFTLYELGLLHKQKGDFNKAIEVMENVK